MYNFNTMNDAFLNKLLDANHIFTPGSPINTKELFSGRLDYVMSVIDTILRPGLHAIMYGERGVGKTSLANVINDFLPSEKNFYSIKISGAKKLSFTEIWRDIFRTMQLHIKKTGFVPVDDEINGILLHFIDQDNPVDITPLDVRFILSQMPNQHVIIILDEFDRITDDETIANMVDTIKTLSDYGIRVTLILVAVGDSIDTIIKEHESLTRSLVQIPLPRMSDKELLKIIEKGLNHLDMTMDKEVLSRIVRLSRGLPHYTHLLSLESVKSSLERGNSNIEDVDLDRAIDESLAKTSDSTIRAYHKAVKTPRGKLYDTILLGCALAECDDRGFFSPPDVRDALMKYTGEDFALPRFTRHLHEFSSQERGYILVQEGDKNQYRYRFSEPMMQPYITLEGIRSGKISKPSD